jgi:hypothetical protein
MVRLTIVLLVAALLAPAAALGQTQQPQNPFGPLPPPQPTATPEPEEQSDPLGENVGVTTLYVIPGGLLIAFVAVGVFISRDARRATAKSGSSRGRLREEGPHKHERKAKAKARARTRAQRAARRRNR